MADTLSERLRGYLTATGKRSRRMTVDYEEGIRKVVLLDEADVEEAAAELDRREAIVAAAEAWAEAYRVYWTNPNRERAQANAATEDALLALLPAAALKG